MIDREQAIQWAKDAGAGTPDALYGRTDYIVMTLHEIQALITRAQNEAFEQAAKQVDHIQKYGGGTLGDEIRALQQETSK